MRINRLLLFFLLAPVVLVLVYIWAISSDRVYVKALEYMPEKVRSWYSFRVLGGHGVMSGESEKAALLLAFVKNRGLFPRENYGDLYDVAIKFQREPIGIMALQISFDSSDRNLICDLWRAEGLRESFMGKLEAYRESNSTEDVRTIEEIVSSCE